MNNVDVALYLTVLTKLGIWPDGISREGLARLLKLPLGVRFGSYELTKEQRHMLELLDGPHSNTVLQMLKAQDASLKK